MLTFLLAAWAMQDQPPIVPIDRPGLDGRGRDPWVFRCIFEDRTRMLIIAPAKDWWMAFNPETCAMHKVWRGKMDFRGKVWDFSQDNSRAAGQILFAAPSEMWRLANGGDLPTGWKAEGVEPDKEGWLFKRAGASLTSPPFEGQGWQRVFLAFDETSRKGRFHVEITGASKPQWFDSTLHVESEKDWQWNFKRIQRPSKDMKITISSPVAGKRLRNVRMYGDKPSWLDDAGHALQAHWDGYELVDRTKGVIIRFHLILAKGQRVDVEQSPNLTQNGWKERFVFRGLPPGARLILTREGQTPLGNSTFWNTRYSFDKDGESTLTFDLSEGQR